MLRGGACHITRLAVLAALLVGPIAAAAEEPGEAEKNPAVTGWITRLRK